MRVRRSLKQKKRNLRTRRRQQKGGSNSVNQNKKAENTGSKQVVVLEPLATMPQICFGTAQANLEKTLPKALNVGYRHIDCADAYSFEARNYFDILKGSFSSFFTKGHAREELWITYKSDTISVGRIQSTIDKLGCKYIDLFLIHHFDKVGGNSLNELVKAKEAGLIRYLGVSNCEDIKIVEALKKKYDIYANQIQARPPKGDIYKAPLNMIYNGRGLNQGFRPRMEPDFIEKSNALGVYIMLFGTVSGASLHDIRYNQPENINKYYIQKYLKPSNVLIVSSINPNSQSLKTNLEDVAFFLSGKELLPSKKMDEIEVALESTPLLNMST